MEMFLGDSFGYFGVWLIGGEVLGEWEDLRSKFGLVFSCLEAFLCEDWCRRTFLGLDGLGWVRLGFLAQGRVRR